MNSAKCFLPIAVFILITSLIDIRCITILVQFSLVIATVNVNGQYVYFVSRWSIAAGGRCDAAESPTSMSIGSTCYCLCKGWRLTPLLKAPLGWTLWQLCSWQIQLSSKWQRLMPSPPSHISRRDWDGDRHTFKFRVLLIEEAL